MLIYSMLLCLWCGSLLIISVLGEIITLLGSEEVEEGVSCIGAEKGLRKRAVQEVKNVIYIVHDLFFGLAFYTRPRPSWRSATPSNLEGERDRNSTPPLS